MPIYDFECRNHGVFSSSASFEASRHGAAGPHCGSKSKVLVALPHISRLSSGMRRAEARAEATSSEPKVMKRKHLPSCGCKLCNRKAPPASRKWMIGTC